MRKFFFRCFDPDPAAGAATTSPGSATTSMSLPPAGGAPGASSTPAPAAFSIPDAYKDRPYLKGIDSHEKLFAAFDGAQKLIGSRPAGIPAPDAPPEEWQKFNEALGVPKDAAEYKFEGVDPAKNPLIAPLQKALQAAGVPASRAGSFYKAMDTAIQEVAKAQGIKAEQENVDFDKLSNDLFKADRDKVMATSKSLIDKFTPAEMKALVAKLPNESLVVMASVLNGIAKTYIKEDAPPGSGPTTGVMSQAEISAKGRQLMADPAYSNPFDPKHAEIKRQVDELYAQLRK